MKFTLSLGLLLRLSSGKPNLNKSVERSEHSLPVQLLVPRLSPELANAFGKGIGAMRNNPRLQRKKVLVHGAQGNLFYAERLVAPETHQLPEQAGNAPRARHRSDNAAPMPTTAPKTAPKTAKPALPVTSTGTPSLFDWANEEKPKFEARPKSSGTSSLSQTTTLSLFDYLDEGTYNATNTTTNTSNRATVAPHGGNPAGNGQNASPAESERVRDGVRADMDTLPTGDGSNVDTRGGSGPEGAGSAGSDGGGDLAPGGAGADFARSETQRSEETPSAARDAGSGDAGSGVSGELAPEVAASPEAPAEPPTEAPSPKRTVQRIAARGLSEEARPDNDLVLTDADEIGKGSLGQKAKDNFAALDLLKELEVDDRQPTDEEKRVLAHYVGWGAFGQAFQDAFEQYADVDWDDISDHVKTYRFSGADKAHFELYKQIKSRLSNDEFTSARASIKNAHYTAPPVVKAMWSALEHMGFTGGRTCEPAMGTGNFYGFMPPELTARSKRTGIELDQVTGKIARYLYPGAQVHIKGFEETPLPDNQFDLVIGNVPFGDYGVVDQDYIRQGRKYLTSKIHNYFISKSLDKARPGGVVAVITSAGTMDARTSKAVREAWAEKAHFLGAIRLPNTAFAESAGTSVTTDIIFLQKKDPAFEALHPRDAQGHFIEKWTESTPVKVRHKDDEDGTGAEYDVHLNEYFQEHPEMMLGKLAVGGGLYNDNQSALENDGRDIVASLEETIQNYLPADIFYRPQDEEERAASDELKQADESIKPGAFHVDGSEIYQNRNGQLVPVETKDPKERKRLIGLYNLCRLSKQLLAQMYEDVSDDIIEMNQDSLNDLYDSFVKEFGDLHKRPNVKAFASDPDAGLLLALEHADRETGAISKADIFSQRTITPHSTAETASSPQDALGIVLNECGELDWRRLSELLNRDPEGIRDELANAGLIFRDPEKETDPVTAGWVTADAYLSGEVKQKLKTARAIAEVDASYAPNIEALEAVQPQPLLPSQIEVRLGAPWVPVQHVNDFITHILGRGSESNLVQFSKHLGWTIKALDQWDSRRGNVALTSEWGTPDANALKVLEATLNMRDVTITMPDPHDREGKRRVTDVAATLAAREKQRLMKNEWKSWIENDAARHAGLADLYNEIFNTTAPRTFDGSHLTFPGMAAGFAKGFRQHAKNAVWRAIQTGNCLFDHVVGAGKTGCIAATTMELRRLRLAKKPMIVVRNPQLEQWEREFREIYPNAKLLIINEGLGKAEKRKEMTHKIATGDWDAVIVAQSTFKEIPASPRLYKEFIEEQLSDLRAALEEENQRASAQNGKKKSRSQKNIERSISSLEVKLKGMEADITEHQDAGLYFDELGVDALLVDEAHDFKNLFFATKMNRISGLNSSASEKAMDLFVKSQNLLKKNNQRGLIFATGTPVSNTLSEMYTMKRYLMLPKLKDLGFDRFDSWASTFGETTTSIEKAPEGGFRQRTRFARFVNVPEMVGLYRQVADVKTRDDLKDILPTPELDGGEPKIVTAPANPELKAYMETLQERAKILMQGDENGRRPDPSEDNFLKITSDGRKAALDLRLMEPGASDNPLSKVNKCVANVARIHAESADRKATQLVFLDLGTPTGESTKKAKAAKAVADARSDANAEANGDANTGDEGLDAEDQRLAGSVYDDIKRKLIAAGIPENEVAFAHDFDTPAKRKEMSRLMDTGQLRVLIGSTSKMGVGLNVQRRLYANHHLDCPWKPGELEQRDGRILRQGNMHHESQWGMPVSIFRYGTEGSFDEYMWQAVAKKAAFIAQTRQGECARTCEDMDETVMTAASMQAALSDNPLMGEKAHVDSDVYRLTQLRKSYLDNRFSVQRKLAGLPRQRDELLQEAADREIAAQHFEKHRLDKFSMTINGRFYDDRHEAGVALAHAHEEALDALEKPPYETKIGHYQGFDIYAKVATSQWDEFDPLVSNLAYQARTPDGHGKHWLRAGSTPASTTTKMDNSLKGLASDAVGARRQAENLEMHLNEYKAVVDKPFEHQEQLDAALRRQTEIDTELAKGSDADTAAAMGYDSPAFFGGIAAMPMAEFKRKVLDTLHGKKLIKSLSGVSQSSVSQSGVSHQPSLRAALLCKSIVVGGGEDCLHCGAVMERGDDGKCSRCLKPWPAATLAVSHPEADGGCKGNCPHCGTTIFADSGEKRRMCHKCKGPFDVIPKGSDYRLEPLKKSLPALTQETINSLNGVQWVLNKSAGEELSKSFKSLKAKLAPFGLGLNDFLRKPDDWETSDNAYYPLPEGEPVVYTTPEVRRTVLAHAMHAALELTQHPKAVVFVAHSRTSQGESIANQFYGGVVGPENVNAILAAIEMEPAEFRLALARLKDETREESKKDATAIESPMESEPIAEPISDLAHEPGRDLAPGEIAI
ncbi:MAG TPA: N-6 DNA methylase [Abditibacteriaceae bacterium]|jgi:N12 class adenine-specific DNA methylase